MIDLSCSLWCHLISLQSRNTWTLWNCFERCSHSSQRMINICGSLMSHHIYLLRSLTVHLYCDFVFFPFVLSLSQSAVGFMTQSTHFTTQQYSSFHVPLLQSSSHSFHLSLHPNLASSPLLCHHLVFPRFVFDLSDLLTSSTHLIFTLYSYTNTSAAASSDLIFYHCWISVCLCRCGCVVVGWRTSLAPG